MKLGLYILTLAIIISSCTTITSSNIPGTKEQAFPSFMKGKFELVYPESFQGFMEGEENKTTLDIQNTKIILLNSEGESTMKLNDSLYISKIKKQYYLSMGESPNFSVFKIIRVGPDLELHALSAKTGTTEEQLKPFFSSIKNDSKMVEETGEMMDSYVVTIDNQKIDRYYKSEYIHVEPFTLKKIK